MGIRSRIFFIVFVLLSISIAITYVVAERDLNNTFNFIPSDKILIETDSPFLAPVPKRGKTNEPSYLKYTLEHMAKIKNISSQEMELITSQNFKKLFEVN